MKFTVCLLAYNHASYIVQAIESILMQKTAFEFDIVIGEDDSNDGTRAIVQDYARRFPDKIHVILGSRSDVHKIHGRVTGRRNYHSVLSAARGEYIALLDGDDFWISAAKLQQQADYFDAHPECTVCGTDAWIDCAGERTKFSARFWKKPGPIYTLEDVLSGDFVPPSCTLALRRSALDFPDMFWRTITGDMALYSICGSRGNFAVLPEPTAVYRVNAGGIYTTGRKPGERAEATPRELEKLQHIALMFEEFLAYLGPRFTAVLRKRLSGIHRDIAWIARELGDFRSMRIHAGAALSYAGFRGPHAVELARLWVAGLAPWLLRFRKQ